MALPAPNLDDRRFQDLVDEAKRRIQSRCPEWTDHNVSDPGVTLIEAFAQMTDLLLYRLNRVPDRNVVTFLELLGLHLYPPAAARAGVTFWLSGPIEEPITVPAGAKVSTIGSDFEPATIFATTTELTIPPCELIAMKTGGPDGVVDRAEVLKGGAPIDAFAELPQPDDHVLFGLSTPLPSCAVELDIDCRIEGVGVDPDNPPLRWEAWDGDDWAGCDVEIDETGGLNRRGRVVVHLPDQHAASVIDRTRAAWLRCRVIPAEDDQPAYTASPELVSARARTAGGTSRAQHAVEITDEVVGMSEGVAGQQFDLASTPVVAGDGPLEIEVAAGPGWERWTQVQDFAESDSDSRVFLLDSNAGQIVFGPAVRLADGTIEQHGAIPPQGAPIRIPQYGTGGGRSGNVGARTITQLVSAIPFIDQVTNRRPASGGVDGETLDNARDRGPIMLRTRNRAVTAEDYEHLARAAAPEIVRVRCLEVIDGEDAGTARVLVVPAVAGEQLRFEDLVPDEGTLARIAEHLEERRTIGARLVVEPPLYQGVTIVAKIRSLPTAAAARVQHEALTRLDQHFHPVTGGPDGTGWPFGRPVHIGEVYAVLQAVEGVGFIEDARLFPADPMTGKRGKATERIDLDRGALVFSYDHQIRVEPPNDGIQE